MNQCASEKGFESLFNPLRLFLGWRQTQKKTSKPLNLGGVESDLNCSQWEAESKRNQEWGRMQAAQRWRGKMNISLFKLHLL